MNITQVILKQLNPIVIEKLKRLAQSHQRTLEEEITSILEDVAEKEEEQTRSEGFWDMTLQFRERMQQENITFDDADFADLRRLVKRLLRKYGYPPEKQEKAMVTVLQQAELLCKDWAA